MAAEAAGSAAEEVAKAEGSSTRDAAVAAATATGMEATAGRRGPEVAHGGPRAHKHALLPGALLFFCEHVTERNCNGNGQTLSF